MEAADSGMAGALDKCCRAEIDTSAPIESVKEAVNLFGGIGYWKPHLHRKPCHENDFEEEAAELEKEMLVKERETLEVLRELEKTESLVEQLTTRLHKETSVVDLYSKAAGKDEQSNKVGGFVGIPSSAPGFILLELKRAKANLVKTSNDLSHLRAAVESYTQRIEKERKAVEMTRESLASITCAVTGLEKDLIETRQGVQLAKDARENDARETANRISQELQRLNSEAADFQKVGEAAKTEVLRAMSDIEMANVTLRIVEMRLIAAQKIKEAARASEAMAIAELKAVINVEKSSSDSMHKDDDVTLSAAEYSSLRSKAQEAEAQCKAKVVGAMVLVDEANLSKLEILRRVKEATEEVKTTKIALEEVLQRIEAANKDKLDLDAALCKRRFEHGHRRRSLHKSGKFKNSCRRKVSGLQDVKMNLKSEWSEPAMRPTLSIGQILSQKLLHPEDENTANHEPNENAAPDISLREMLSIKKSENVSKSVKVEQEGGEKQQSAKRKTFGLGRFSILLAKQSKKKKTMPSLKYCTGKTTNPHDRLSFG